jgi:hypothetical protein
MRGNVAHREASLEFYCSMINNICYMDITTASMHPIHLQPGASRALPPNFGTVCAIGLEIA